MSKNKGVLQLLPNVLADTKHHELYLPASVDRAVEAIDGLIAESGQEALRFLKRFKTKKLPHMMPVALYNKNTLDKDIDFLLEPIAEGERWGMISDAGLPCVADPGASLVFRARQLGIAIQAFVGPSSVILSLMLSGLPGQRFFFHGYLDKEPGKRRGDVKNLEKLSKDNDATQIFIEAPYRNSHMLDTLLNTLSDKTLLAVAWDLTLPTQGIVSQPVSTWKKMPLPNLEKKAAIFLLYNDL